MKVFVISESEYVGIYIAQERDPAPNPTLYPKTRKSSGLNSLYKDITKPKPRKLRGQTYLLVQTPDN